MTTRRTAVSYSRFSDPAQAAGDSAERQEHAYRAFCQRHNLTPGKEVFADPGRSGYSGEHRSKGRLGQLIQAAKDGRFEPGTVVVIEAWDRLGRLRPDRQTELVSELLRTGVNIGVCRLEDIFTEEDFGSHKWTTLAVFIQLAHQESKQKGERVAASWQRRRERARATGRLVGSNLPAWVEVVDDEPRAIPERAAAIRRIYQLAADGVGQVRIVRQLRKEKIPPFGERVVRAGRKRSYFAGEWTKAYVGLLLKDPRVTGCYQPTKGGKPDGPVIKGYYPQIITEEQFALARAGQGQRVKRDKLGRACGSRQSKYVNVFQSMLTHARDGGGFVLYNRGTAERPQLVLFSAGGVDGRAERSYTIPYPVLERQVLRFVREIDPESVLPTKPAASAIDVLRAKLAAVRQDVVGLKAELKVKFSKGIAEVLREQEDAEEKLVNQIQDELARTARPLERAWADVPTLIDVIDTADDKDAARLRVRAALRAVLDSGTVLTVAKGAWRFFAVQLNFTGGAVRHCVVAHRPAANGRAASTHPLSFADAFPKAGDIDLRKREDCAKMERLLSRLDLGKW